MPFTSWSKPAGRSQHTARTARHARITDEIGAVVNLFPGLHRSQDWEWLLNWLSTRVGAPAVFELPLASADRYAERTTENRLLPPGYPHRIVATPRPGVYLSVWVQGPEGAQDIYYRLFEK